MWIENTLYKAIVMHAIKIFPGSLNFNSSANLLNHNLIQFDASAELLFYITAL